VVSGYCKQVDVYSVIGLIGSDMCISVRVDHQIEGTVGVTASDSINRECDIVYEDLDVVSS